MFNPFYPFSTKLLNAFVQSGKKYFVRQSFPRGFNYIDENIKGYFLISQYAEQSLAEQHFNVLKNDPNKFLYEWDNPDHQEKLKIAADNPEGYKIFANVFDHKWQAMVTPVLKQKVRTYVENKLRWSPKRNDVVNPDFFVQYGELFARLKWQNQEARVNFAEIENIGSCVTTSVSPPQLN